MNKFFRFFALVLTIVLTVGIMTACGIMRDNNPGNTGTTEIDYSAGKNYEGELKIYIQNSEGEKLIMDKIVESFKKQYKNIKVTVKDFVASNYAGSLRNEAALSHVSSSATMADVFWVSDSTINAFYDADMLMSLNEVWKNDEAFDASLLLEGSIRSASYNNNVYFMPRDYNEIVMYYNKDMFDEAGVAYPTDAMDAESFLEMLAGLKSGLATSQKLNGLKVPYGTAVTYVLDSFGPAANYVYGYLKSFGGDVVDSEGNVVYDAEQTYEAYKFWQDMIKAGYVPDASAVTGGSGAQFQLQQAALCFQARPLLTSYVNGIRNSPGIGDDLGVVAIPNFGGQKYVGAGSSGYAMYKESKNKTAAWLFLKFVVSEMGQEAFCESGNGVPVLKSLLNDENSNWRSYNGGFDGLMDFNHDAFVYAATTEGYSVVNTNDFLGNFTIKNQTQVSEAFVNCFSNCGMLTYVNGGERLTKELIKEAADDIRYFLKG